MKKVLASAWPGQASFRGSAAYWEQRYARGGDSGVGSSGRLAQFKADLLNDFFTAHAIDSVIEFGCGDGRQLKLLRCPRYLGFDVSRTAVATCARVFRNDPTKGFALMADYSGQRADLTLSLDVIYHLVENAVFERYMTTLFAAANRYVIAYSSNADDDRSEHDPHVRHRKFTDWVDQRAPSWRQSAHIANPYPFRGDLRTGTAADFFVFERARPVGAG